MGSAATLSSNAVIEKNKHRIYDFTFESLKEAQIGNFFMMKEIFNSTHERLSDKKLTVPEETNLKKNAFLTRIKKKLTEVSPACSVWDLWKSHYNFFVIETYSDIPLAKGVSEEVIQKDITRTFPNHPFFETSQYGLYGQYALYRVLCKFSSLYPKIGYCQGMNYIIGFLLMISGSKEPEVLSFFIHLCQEFSLFDYFSEEMLELHKNMWIFDKLLKKYSPELLNHFIVQELTDDMWIFKWFLSLYTTTFDLKSVPFIWGYFIERGPRGLFELALGILSLLKTELLKSDLSEILELFEELSSGKLSAKVVISAANKHKIKSKKLEKLREEHRVFSNKLKVERKSLENLKAKSQKVESKSLNDLKSKAKEVDKNCKSQHLVVQEITETLDDLPPFFKSKSGYCTPNRGMAQGPKVFDYYKMGRVSFVEDKTLAEDESVNAKQFLDDLISEKTTGDSFIIQVCKNNK